MIIEDPATYWTETPQMSYIKLKLMRQRMRIEDIFIKLYEKRLNEVKDPTSLSIYSGDAFATKSGAPLIPLR